MTITELLAHGCSQWGDSPTDYTDKQTPNGHSYGEFYQQVLGPLQNSIRLLEIGVSSGGSLDLWRNYFDCYDLWAIDYAPAWHTPRPFQQGIEADPDCHTLWRKNSFLAETYESIPGFFDVVIDDGDHTPEGQVKTFTHAYGKLAPGGLYVIEDVMSPRLVPGIIKEISLLAPGALIQVYEGLTTTREDDIIIWIRKPQ